MLLKLTSNLSRLTFMSIRQFGMLNDYLTQKTMKKQEGEFKKEMEYLANKPTFTLMDYKQRIEDELARANSSNSSYIQTFEAKLTKNLKNRQEIWRWRRKS